MSGERAKISPECYKATQRAGINSLGRPFEDRLLVMQGAVSEVQVYQILVRHSYFGGQCLEVGDGPFIQPDRDGLLES